MSRYLRLISSVLFASMLFPLVGCVGGDVSTSDRTDVSSDVSSESSQFTDGGNVTDSDSGSTDSSDAGSSEDDWEELREKAKNEGIKVLFIGDSLTHYNEMPQIFQQLCAAAGKKVTAVRQTKGGTGIAMFREDASLWQTLIDKINSDDWDIVVYQPNRNNPVMTEFFPYYPWKEYQAASDLADLIKQAGAIPLQYSSFGVNKGYVTREGRTKHMTRKEHTDLVTAYNAGIADLLGNKVVYTGATFNSVIAKNPTFGMYHTDNSHPSLLGSYLIAADFYTVIFGESPEKVEYTHGIDAGVAATLRAAAAELLTFQPKTKAEIKHVEEENKEKGTLTFGAHAFKNVAGAGISNVFDVTADNSKISYTYKNGDGIFFAFAYLEGYPVSGNNWTFEADVSIDKYGGSKNPTAGLQLIDEKGTMYRLYLRTTAAKIQNNDCTTAEYHIRTDHDSSASRTDKGTFTNKIKVRLEVTPDSMTLFVDGEMYVTITAEGMLFYDGTKSTKMKYDGADVQLGLVTCYGDTSFSNVVIK